MRIDCQYSPIFHCLVIAIHLAAVAAVLGSSLLLIFKVLLIAELLFLALRAHRDHRQDSSTRIQAFLIWDQWAELVVGREESASLRVALPRVCYASEYLLVLRFEAIEPDAKVRRGSARVLSIVPGMLSQTHYGSLLQYLRFGIKRTQSHGVSMVSRASSACSG